MSLETRVADARFLWANGRREGALLNAVIAVAATARRRFPDRKAVGDREAFERFLEAVQSVRMSVEYRGACEPIEHILYKWLRCELVHEGGLPVDIEFVQGDPDVLSVRAGGKPDFVLRLSESWFDHLIGAVVSAPENAGLFPGGAV